MCSLDRLSNPLLLVDDVVPHCGEGVLRPNRLTVPMGIDAYPANEHAPSRGRRPRVVTGDRPTGPLHLGHLVGTLHNRVLLQETHETFILIADQHMLTTRLDRVGEIETNIREDVLGNLAVGIDPDKATIYLQSQVSQTAELFLYFAMLVSVSRAQRIPTLKDQVRELRIAQPSYGLLGYPILQAADILLMRADVVPVGPDQRSHVELAREIARTFNGRFAPVFPVPTALAPRGGTLPGTDGSPKMSRSVGNTIDLFDDEETVRTRSWRCTRIQAEFGRRTRAK